MFGYQFSTCKELAAIGSCLLLALSTADAGAPAPKQNYVPIVLVDSSGLNTPQSIYFVAHALDPSGLPCYLVPDASGICQYVYPTTSGTPGSADPSISKSLKDLPPATGTGQTDPSYLIYLPICSSARGYLSVDIPMYLPTQFNNARGVLDINDPSQTSIQDSNYYTWYQDFEFGLVYNNGNVATGANLASQIFLNLSWVDFFSLPMKLEVFSYPTNQAIQGIATFVSGYDPTLSRDTLMADIQSVLKAADSAGGTTWSNLSVPYYQNQYSNATPEGYVRILAAKNSIALKSSLQFQGAATGASQTFFPDDYASNTIYGPTGSTNFFSALYNYYGGNTLTTQIFPAGGVPSFVYTYQISSTGASSLQFTYTGTTPPYGPTPTSPITLDLSTLTTEELLSGSTWPFQPSNATVAVTNELSKLISALFTIGSLPLNTGQLTATPPTDLNCTGYQSAPTFVNNNCGFATIAPRSGQTDSYFHNPAPLNPQPPTFTFSKGPWYNVYDTAVHQYQIKNQDIPNNPSYGLGYGYDYDDLLNMAGLINPLVQDQYASPASNGTPSLPNAYVVVTLGNLTGTPVLNINNDTYTTNQMGYNSYEIIPYTIHLGPLSADTTMVVNFIWFDGTQTHTTPAPTSGTTAIANLVADANHPFQVQFKYNDVTYTYTINLLRQVVTPSSPTNPYSATDVSLINGITFQLQTGNIIQINSASTAPAWPG